MFSFFLILLYIGSLILKEFTQVLPIAASTWAFVLGSIIVLTEPVGNSTILWEPSNEYFPVRFFASFSVITWLILCPAILVAGPAYIDIVVVPSSLSVLVTDTSTLSVLTSIISKPGSARNASCFVSM